MRRPGRAARRRRLPLTPLVDVIFLLLLFFMLSSTFARHAEVELNFAGAAPGPPTQPVFVRLADDGVTVNGRPVGPDGLRASVERYRGTGPLPLLLSVGGAKAQQLVDTVVALRSVPRSRLAVLR